MDLKFLGSDLYKGFNLVADVVPSSTVKHILQGIKLEVQEGMAEITATDLEVLVKYVIPMKEYSGEGCVVLPAARVNNILREWAGSNEVLISVDNGNCLLKSNYGYFKIAGEDFRQFPGMIRTDVNGFVEVEGEIIGSMVGKVIHAVSLVKARSTLCGVLVKIERDNIILVTADGNSISTVKCLSFLQRFVSECKGVLKVGIGESQIRFVGEKGEVISQLIDGQYPKYEDVIPKQNDKKVEVDKVGLLSIVRMASFMTNEGYRVVRFVFRQGKLVLLSKAADIGESELEIPVNYDGNEFEVCFNPDYVLDAVKVSD